MIRVVPKPHETIAVTLRRFRKICEREGVMRDVKRKQAYEKPSERRRRQKLRAIKRSYKERLEEEARLKSSRR